VRIHGRVDGPWRAGGPGWASSAEPGGGGSGGICAGAGGAGPPVAADPGASTGGGGPEVVTIGRVGAAAAVAFVVAGTLPAVDAVVG